MFSASYEINSGKAYSSANNFHQNLFNRERIPFFSIKFNTIARCRKFWPSMATFGLSSFKLFAPASAQPLSIKCPNDDKYCPNDEEMSK